MIELGIMDYSLLIGIHDVVKGNKDNIRDTTLSVFEPNPQSLTRRASVSYRNGKTAHKKTTQDTDIVQLGPSNAKLPHYAPPE